MSFYFHRNHMKKGLVSAPDISLRKSRLTPVDWSRVIQLPLRSRTGVPIPLPDHMLFPGTVLVRVWRGRTHVVYVRSVSRKFLVSTEGGEGLATVAERHGYWRYVYEGRRYRSLSGIATMLGDTTGKGYWRYGAAFFGLVVDHARR